MPLSGTQDRRQPSRESPARAAGSTYNSHYIMLSYGQSHTTIQFHGERRWKAAAIGCRVCVCVDCDVSVSVSAPSCTS